jgi:transketolase
MVISDALVKDLENKTRENRKKLVEVLYKKKGGGHFGGSLSCMEILTVLFTGILNIDPKNPKWEKRDYFLLSKGHTNAAFATVLASKGYFSEEKLSKATMHPKDDTPGVEISTGSLGHGLSLGLGIAAALKLNKMNSKVYVLLGDGELHEGQNWEAMQTAAGWHLDNLVAIVDRNMLGMDGPTETVTIPLESLADKWRSFNWEVKTVDGHNVRDLVTAFTSIPFQPGKPSVVIAKTIKGKGVSFMENQTQWHMGVINEEQYKTAISDIEGA